MKLSNVTSVHKERRYSKKGSCCPVSFLPNSCRFFERCIYKHISEYLENDLPNHQCGFRKGHREHHYLIALLDKWRDSIDQTLEFGILLTDLFKAFNCLSHYLFIAKLVLYGFDKIPLRFTYTSWQEILYQVPKDQF